jgi:hypothetical protein
MVAMSIVPQVKLEVKGGWWTGQLWIESASRPGLWHHLEPLEPRYYSRYRCSCRGFLRHGHCWHARLAERLRVAFASLCELADGLDLPAGWVMARWEKELPKILEEVQV